MFLLKSLKIKNFVSFDSSAQEIGDFNNLNILIGRNNQGKSNFLKAIQFLDYNHLISFLNNIPDEHEKLREHPHVTVGESASAKLRSIFHYPHQYFSHIKDAHFLEPIELTYTIEIDNELHEYEIKFESLCNKANGMFRYIDKDGIYRDSKTPVSTYFDGKATTLNEVLGNPKEIVHQITWSNIDSKYYENIKENLLKSLYEDEDKESIQNFFSELNACSPDFHELYLHFADYAFPSDSSGRNYWDVEKEIYRDKWYNKAELFLTSGRTLNFNNIGSGQQQAFALLYEIVNAEDNEATIITIDEMELHLYPALQKNLFKKIKDRSENMQFFISTHSNILISTPLNQRIFFVRKENNSTSISLRKTTQEIYEILDDLGIKASDILQSNGVIWVEGPSDKIIIKDWLLKIGVSKEDLDQISIVFYGGILIRRIDFKELLKLNRNCVVIQDSDKRSVEKKLENGKSARARAKIRVIKDCEELGIYCWTTTRREIENYFSLKSIKKFFLNHPKMNKKQLDLFDNYMKIGNIIKSYNGNKVLYSNEIVSYMSKEDILKNTELKSELTEIHNKIKIWNTI